MDKGEGGDTPPIWGEWPKGMVPPGILHIQNAPNEVGGSTMPPNHESHLTPPDPPVRSADLCALPPWLCCTSFWSPGAIDVRPDEPSHNAAKLVGSWCVGGGGGGAVATT